MGQYYVVVNVDKREYFSASDFSGFVKLMEWSYRDNECNQAMLHLMAGKWKGDRVYVVGDYAVCDNVNDTYYNVLDELEMELGFKDKKSFYESANGEVEEYDITLYSYACDNFTHLKKFPSNKKDIRYVYNTVTNQYLDLEQANIAWGHSYVEKGKVFSHVVQYSPISLLLAMGNGRGGGDYHSSDKDTERLVGFWCECSQNLIVSDKPLKEFSKFEEYNPNFFYGEELFSYEYIPRLKDALSYASMSDYYNGKITESHCIEDYRSLLKLEGSFKTVDENDPNCVKTIW